MGNFLVFAIIGLVAGCAARMWYSGQQFMRFLGNLILGMIGGLAGGMISWIYWPRMDDQFHSGNLLLSFFGAVIVIMLWEAVAYARNRNGSGQISP